MKSILMILVCALSLLPGCAEGGSTDNVREIPRGRKVSVQIRRDLLGAASDIPSGALTDIQNGAVVSVSGELESQDREWIVIKFKPGKAKGSTLWIPRRNILLVRVWDQG